VSLANDIFLQSKELKAVLNVTDCELMHLRLENKVQFTKQGNAFLYALPANTSLLSHPLGKQLLNWHKEKHQSSIENQPSNSESRQALELLIKDILLPIERKFKRLRITYGFTSPALKTYIAKNSPLGTAPALDQHSSCELNSKRSEICKRGGAACDFIVCGLSMAVVVRYISEHLNFDRIYYYGDDRPVHVSVSEQPNKHLQIMHESENGRRYPSLKGFGIDAVKLAATL
jgi:hypothetical protein